MAPAVPSCSRIWSCKDFDEEQHQQAALSALHEQHSIYFDVKFAPQATPQGLQLLFAAHSSGCIRVVDWQAAAAAWTERKQQGCVHSQWAAHSEAVYRLALHAAAGLLVSAGDDGYLRLWRLSDVAAAVDAVALQPAQPGGAVPQLTGIQPVAEVLLPRTPGLSPVGSAAQPAAQALTVDASSHHVYVGSSDGGVFGYDLQRLVGAQHGSSSSSSSSSSSPAPGQLMAGHLAGVLDLDVCPSMQQLASGSEDGTLRAWDLRTASAVKVVAPWAGEVMAAGDARAAMAVLGQPAVSAVAFSPTGSFLVAGSANASLTLLDAQLDQVAGQARLDKCVPQALLLQPANIYVVGSAPWVHRCNFLLEPGEHVPLSATNHYCGLDLEPETGLMALGGSQGALEFASPQGQTAGRVRRPVLCS